LTKENRKVLVSSKINKLLLKQTKKKSGHHDGSRTSTLNTEVVGIFLCEYLGGLVDLAAEGGALDLDDLGDLSVSLSVFSQLSDLECFRHQFLQILKQVLQLIHVADDVFRLR